MPTLHNHQLHNPSPRPTTLGLTMEIKHILIIMFVVFGLFMLANWFNRPRK